MPAGGGTDIADALGAGAGAEAGAGGRNAFKLNASKIGLESHRKPGKKKETQLAEGLTGAAILAATATPRKPVHSASDSEEDMAVAHKPLSAHSPPWNFQL